MLYDLLHWDYIYCINLQIQTSRDISQLIFNSKLSLFLTLKCGHFCNSSVRKELICLVNQKLLSNLN